MKYRLIEQNLRIDYKSPYPIWYPKIHLGRRTKVLILLTCGMILRFKLGQGGLEPPTSPLSGVRSNQLSYRPNGCSVKIKNDS